MCVISEQRYKFGVLSPLHQCVIGIYWIYIKVQNLGLWVCGLEMINWKYPM